MPAKFEKVSIMPLGVVDGFDSTVDSNLMYQMVPLAEGREMAVVTEEEECIIIVDPPGIARMQRFVFSAPLHEVPSDFKAKVTRRNRITFQIFGQSLGNTTIFLVDRTGRATAGLMISVKSVVVKTIALCLLSDIKSNCPFKKEEIPPIITLVQATYKQQANLTISQLGSILDVTVPANLGKTIILDQPGIHSKIVGATPLEAFAADLIVYFTWDIFSIKFKEIVGLTKGTACYVEQQNSLSENGLTTAHEIGHGLGLKHSKTLHLMNGNGNRRDSILRHFEIDKINQTDRSP